MALFRDAVFKRWPNVRELIQLEKAKINLKPINKLTIRFDPFNDGVTSIRKFNYYIHETNIIRTNPKCIIKTEILTDRSDSHIVFDLTDGKQFIFKCQNLKCLEILKLMNEHITPLAPAEDILSVPMQKTQRRK